MHRFAMIALVLTGCLTQIEKEEEFAANYRFEYCERYDICATPEMLQAWSTAECHHGVGEPLVDYSDCKFDQEKAEACLDQLSYADCDRLTDDVDVPSVCGDVYTCRLGDANSDA